MNIRLLFLFFCFPTWLHAQQHAHKVVGMMGSRFEFTAVAQTDSLAWAAIRAGIKEVQRIEELISSWDPHSQTSEINRQAGLQPVKVVPELYQLIRRSLKISQLTEGAFDISFASLDRVWKFDGSMESMPSDSLIAASVAKINHQDIILDADESSVFLAKTGMRIGFGGIGKGYAANRARQKMTAMGVQGGLVNAGGDLSCWGTPPKGESWTIGIASPQDKDHIIGWLAVDDLAVVTSGDYERFVMIDDSRYAHIIDPKTGWPVRGLKSVTVSCPDAELADALATSVFVLGKEKGMALINQLNGVECLMITDHDEVLYSDNMRLTTEAAQK
ncbi:MAG: FAD:protein FMN transferase [Bacteroidota bacterium]